MRRFLREQEILNFLNNELVGYIIDISAIVIAVVTGVAMLYGKVKKFFNSAKALINKNNEDTVSVNRRLDSTNSKIEEVSARYEKVIAEMKEAQQEMQRKYEENIKELVAVTTQFKPIMKLPNALAKVMTSTPDMVKSGNAKKFCDEIGLNDTNFDKAENTQKQA